MFVQGRRRRRGRLVWGGVFVRERPSADCLFVWRRCYYVGPILTALIPSAPAQASNDIDFPQWFTTAEQQATATDNWVAGSMMRAFQRCRRGGAAAQAPPAWLDRSFPASSLQATRVAQPNAVTSQQGLVTSGGRRLLA